MTERVTSLEGHRHWAASYDAALNPLLALETRVVLSRVDFARAHCFLDVACGTGRWMQLAQKYGAHVFGIDFCPEMLEQASAKPGLAGRISLGDVCRIPVADGTADLALCSFALGYVSSLDRALGEMARIARNDGRVIVTDIHPLALAAGWTRSFRSNGTVYEMDHYPHSIAAWEEAGSSAGLCLEWRFETSFAEPEREIFRQAGKESLFSAVNKLPALLAMSWVKSCD